MGILLKYEIITSEEVSEIEDKKIKWIGWLFTYLFATKVFIWYDKLAEFDSLWATFIHYFIFRDSFIIALIIGMIVIATIIDDCITPLRQLSESKRWVIYHAVLYIVFALVFFAHNWILNRFFQATFETWQALWLRWTVLYAVLQVAFYIKYWIPMPKKKRKKIAIKQRIRLKSGVEAIVVEIINEGERYKVDVPCGGGDFVQREISPNGIKSVFESIETPFETTA